MTDRFEFLTQLGRGGMGVVWRARDTDTGEIVAVKLLHDLYAGDADYVARFEREVEIGRRIQSPNVVRVLGFGRRDGAPYLVMEYVDGQSLKELLKERGQLPWDEARPILRQVAEGLQAAHDAGVIHRDVKPSNILLAPDGTAKVADFGIARASDLTALTGGATMLGTPMYMAPEATTTPAGDWYAFGCIVYEMLAGAPPFTGDTMQQVLIKHMRDEPDLAKLPPQAHALVGALLDKDPQRRMRGVRQGLPDIADHVPGPPVEVVEHPPVARAPEWRPVRTLRGDVRVTALAFSSVEPLLAVGFNDGRIAVWRWTDVTSVMKAKHGETGITYLAFHPQGGLLVSVNAAGSAATHELPARYWPSHLADDVRQLIFDRTGRQIAIVGRDGSVGVAPVDLRSRTIQAGVAVVPIRPYGSFAASTAAFSPSGKSLAVGGMRGRVARVDIAKNQVTKVMNAPVSGNVRHITHVDDDRVRWGAGPLLWEWSRTSDRNAHLLRHGAGAGQPSALSSDGAWFAQSDGTQVLLGVVIDDANGSVPARQPLDAPHRLPVALAFAPDNSLLAVGTAQGIVELFRHVDQDS